MTYTPIVKGTQDWDVPLNAALAQLDASITTASGDALQASNNLSDLTNVTTARANLNLTGLANALSNMTATTDPTVSSDNTQGYSIGSTWFNTVAVTMWVAVSVATGAAVWAQIPPTFVDQTTAQSIAGNKTFTALTNFSNASTTAPVVTITSTANTGQGQRVVSNQAADTAIGVRVAGDTNARLTIGGDGKITWGPGNAPGDVNFYRSSSTVVRTDNNLQAANLTPGIWTTYTPTWTSTGTAPVVNNGVLIGRYTIAGKSVTVIVNLAAGNTTTFGTGAYTFALPFQAANQSATAIGNVQLATASLGRWAGHAIIAPNGTTVAPFVSTSATDPRLAALSGTVPVTLDSTSQIRLTFTYEMV